MIAAMPTGPEHTPTMKIVYHLGLHCTDDEKLVTCLRANAPLLATEGIVVPDPDRYRSVLRDTMNATRGAGVSRETQETVLDAVMDEDEADRLVFSNQAFLCKRQKVLSEGTLYPMAAEKVGWMAGLFPDHQVEFHFAIRNPATFIPALFEREKERDYTTFMDGIEPHRLRWSEMIGRIRAALPKARLTVWCDEDTPLIWPDVLRAVSGHGDATMLAGTLEVLEPIISPEGLRRMTDYLTSHPPQTPAQHRRIVGAFFDKYVMEDALEMELDLPGWDEEYVETLTQLYDTDMVKISEMDGVTFIAP
ncbi:hypothetical protein [Acidimangrovimonas sediminis]|uniref:hypothetical protein n=1 Tax=Acidimangrovimonas sediminis TaxID=2056283 RepID=UPI000C8016B5|nr:hypothetical protein [Acidimangrovimonas sediminis]